MPFSPTLWFAAGLLWILDAANNVTMEPYRAYVSDRLERRQHSLGFLTQSAFTGLAQTLAYLAPSLLVFLGMNKDAVNANHIPHITVAAFLVGARAVVHHGVLVGEDRARAAADRRRKRTRFERARAALLPPSPTSWSRSARCPPTMRQLWWMKLFQWYGMMCYWIYIVPRLWRARCSARPTPTSPGFRDASLLNGQIGGFYNFVAFVAAFAMVPFTRRLRRQAGACGMPGAGRRRHVGHPVDPRQGLAVRADARRGPGLGLDHGQSVRAAGGQHSARKAPASTWASSTCSSWCRC
jgi:maltose/moltooligosaccharide transporter